MQLSAAQHSTYFCCCSQLAVVPLNGCCKFPNKQHAYSTTHTCVLSICRHAARNLHHPYLPGKLAGNIKTAAEVTCSRDTRLTRTIDGTCNYPGMSLALNLGCACQRWQGNSRLAADLAKYYFKC